MSRPVMPTRVLIVGSGGREHALAWKLASEPGVNDVVVAPGSDGIAAEDRVVRAADTDFEAARIIDACRAHAIELAVVGPEGPLADGMVDELVAAGITTFGPSQQPSSSTENSGTNTCVWMRT